MGLSELEKWDFFSPAVKVSFMCGAYVLRPLDLLAFTLGTHMWLEKGKKSMYGRLINSVLLEQLFCYGKRRKRLGGDSYFCCFPIESQNS